MIHALLVDKKNVFIVTVCPFRVDLSSSVNNIFKFNNKIASQMQFNFHFCFKTKSTQLD